MAAKVEVAPIRAADPAPRPTLVAETAGYRVLYGILGEVAEGTVSLIPDSSPATGGNNSPRKVLRAVGAGKGAVLGFARTEKRIESEFDPQTLNSTRWTITRTNNDRTTIDIAEQKQPGTVSLLRKCAGEPDQSSSITRSSPILDPLGFLLRLRLGRLQAPASFEILDERALWIMSISAVRTTGDDPPMLRVDGRSEPVGWDGSPDPGRTGRRFSLFLSNDGYRTPVRLVVPFGVGEARADLVTLSRPTTDPPALPRTAPPFRRYLPGKKEPQNPSPPSLPVPAQRS